MLATDWHINMIQNKLILTTFTEWGKKLKLSAYESKQVAKKERIIASVKKKTHKGSDEEVREKTEVISI